MGNKWYGSNYEVIKAFVDDPFDDRGGRNSQGNVYFHGDGIIYSYGEHFPMAAVLEKHKKEFFVVNGDGASVTTNRHREDLFSCLRNRRGAEYYVVVPFSSLAQAMGHGTRWSREAYYTARDARENLEVVDHKEDYWTTKQVWVTDKETGEKELKDVREHFLGGALLRIDDEYFLSGIDQSGRDRRGMYFLTKLPRPASSVDDAYLAIKPKGLNGEAYVRQGEFFLVPQDMKKPRGIPVEKKMRLENRGRDERRWRHVATEGFRLNGIQYVRGTVRHPEHKMVFLENVWHRVYEATGAGPDGEIVSWSASGGFD